MNTKSYPGKKFIVESSKALVRNGDDLSKFQTYKDGDDIPPDKKVGDIKLIPKRAEVFITDVKTDSDRHVFVLARPATDDDSEPFGWTSSTNLLGGFLNETVGLAPAKWDLEPAGNNKTCTDRNAIIREGPPSFTSKGTTVPEKSFVAVTETSGDKKFVRVSRARVEDGQLVVDEELGWTAASNLSDGCSDIYFSNEWTNQKGPNACWQHGAFIGQKLLVNIVGAGGEMEQITLDSLDAYMRLRDAAAESNIELAIESAFRTFQKQVELRHLFETGRGNLAAKPGTSNHQHGQAFDLNTHGFDGDTNYDWLKRNGPALGFIRAVNKEHWHWEYRPQEAAQLARQGKFKMPGVDV